MKYGSYGGNADSMQCPTNLPRLLTSRSSNKQRILYNFTFFNYNESNLSLMHEKGCDYWLIISSAKLEQLESFTRIKNVNNVNWQKRKCKRPTTFERTIIRTRKRQNILLSFLYWGYLLESFSMSIEFMLIFSIYFSNKTWLFCFKMYRWIFFKEYYNS